MIDNASLGPDRVLEQAEQQRLIRQFVDELPEEKREVFKLVHEAEMELKEVAERLAIPEGTVKSRLYHARKKIAADWQTVKNEWEKI